MRMNLRPKPATSAAHALRRGAFRAVMITAAIALGYGGMYAAQGGQAGPQIVFPESPEVPAQVAPPAKGSPAWLIEKHGCWTGEAPADMQGEVPGHVVIRYEGETAAKYRGTEHVGTALSHLFDAPDPSVAEVYGFCR